MTSHLFFQLYCRPAETNAVRLFLARQIALYPKFSDGQTALENQSDSGSDIHLTWMQQHPGQDPVDRAYFLLAVACTTDVPDAIIGEVEASIWDWIDTTYHLASNDVREVHVASSAGTWPGS